MSSLEPTTNHPASYGPSPVSTRLVVLVTPSRNLLRRCHVKSLPNPQQQASQRSSWAKPVRRTKLHPYVTRLHYVDVYLFTPHARAEIEDLRDLRKSPSPPSLAPLP
ncbi:hypothetical protein EVAR_45318_1 [Eumeta japonica]|uniref:Uncharacterized protein n=1 Tax=Eumeta variegata TaxID=151549 RepID=A0A4C1XMC2_EUMVA|nr:hypothetical protein EVAR_45318_1 [Eumeta japonica]